MRGSLIAILGLVFVAGSAMAQIPSGNVFFGYSYSNVDLASLGRAGTNGWEATAEGKVLPLLGIVADFSSHYGTKDTTVFPPNPLCPRVCEPLVVPESLTEHNYLFGPRLGVPIGKFRPFAEALFGISQVHIGGGSDTSFATALGGGLDYRLIHFLAWRVQGDYVQSRFFSNTQNNVRISTGIVLRF